MPSHIPRTLKLLKADGWTVEKVEQWIAYPHRLNPREMKRLEDIAQHAGPGACLLVDLRWLCKHLLNTQSPNGVRKDLFGFGDLLAFRQDPQAGPDDPVGEFRIIQVCARAGLSAHRKKIASCPEAQLWVQAGGEIELIGWAKGKQEPHHKRRVWIPKREMVR